MHLQDSATLMVTYCRAQVHFQNVVPEAVAVHAADGGLCLQVSKTVTISGISLLLCFEFYHKLDRR